MFTALMLVVAIPLVLYVWFLFSAILGTFLSNAFGIKPTTALICAFCLIMVLVLFEISIRE
jgi:hypothetical protein